MLVPPTSGILASAVDPLRKRPTTFSRNTQEVEIDSTVWTETPLEKAQRLADEVAGIKRKKPSTSGQGGGHESGRKRMRDEEIRASVDRHNVSHEFTGGVPSWRSGVGGDADDV